MAQIAPPLERIEKITITDTNLAAALLTIGCAPYDGSPVMPLDVVKDDGTIERRRSFRFKNHPDTKAYVAAWSTKENWAAFEQANPEHPLCYIRWFCYNKDRYLDAIKQSAVLEFRRHPTKAECWMLRKIPPHAR